MFNNKPNIKSTDCEYLLIGHLVQCNPFFGPEIKATILPKCEGTQRLRSLEMSQYIGEYLMLDLQHFSSSQNFAFNSSANNSTSHTKNSCNLPSSMPFQDLLLSEKFSYPSKQYSDYFSNIISKGIQNPELDSTSLFSHVREIQADSNPFLNIRTNEESVLHSTHKFPREPSPIIVGEGCQSPLISDAEYYDGPRSHEHSLLFNPSSTNHSDPKDLSILAKPTEKSLLFPRVKMVRLYSYVIFIVYFEVWINSPSFGSMDSMSTEIDDKNVSEAIPVLYCTCLSIEKCTPASLLFLFPRLKTALIQTVTNILSKGAVDINHYGLFSTKPPKMDISDFFKSGDKYDSHATKATLLHNSDDLDADIDNLKYKNGYTLSIYGNIKGFEKYFESQWHLALMSHLFPLVESCLRETNRGLYLREKVWKHSIFPQIRHLEDLIENKLNSEITMSLEHPSSSDEIKADESLLNLESHNSHDAGNLTCHVDHSSNTSPYIQSIPPLEFLDKLYSQLNILLTIVFTHHSIILRGDDPKEVRKWLSSIEILLYYYSPKYCVHSHPVELDDINPFIFLQGTTAKVQELEPILHNFPYPTVVYDVGHSLDEPSHFFPLFSSYAYQNYQFCFLQTLLTKQCQFDNVSIAAKNLDQWKFANSDPFCNEDNVSQFIDGLCLQVRDLLHSSKGQKDVEESSLIDSEEEKVIANSDDFSKKATKKSHAINSFSIKSDFASPTQFNIPYCSSLDSSSLSSTECEKIQSKSINDQHDFPPLSDLLINTSLNGKNNELSQHLSVEKESEISVVHNQRASGSLPIFQNEIQFYTRKLHEIMNSWKHKLYHFSTSYSIVCKQVHSTHSFVAPLLPSPLRTKSYQHSKLASSDINNFSSISLTKLDYRILHHIWLQ